MRFANVLGWKREDGSRIPVTAAGLEEHKALVAKYELETGSPIRSAYRGIIDRKYARVEKKLAEGEVARGKSEVRANTEKRRAILAKRLHKWLDRDGSKLPSTPAGIKRHKALVSSYEEMFGPSSDLDREARARTYQAILDGIEREKVRRKGQAQRSKEIVAQQKRADAERRAMQRAERKRRNAERAKSDAASDRRSRQRKARYCRYRIELAKRRVDQGERNVVSDESLESYWGTSEYEGILKARERAKELLVIFRGNLADYKARLAALQL